MALHITIENLTHDQGPLLMQATALTPEILLELGCVAKITMLCLKYTSNINMCLDG